jgi:hypothetical protein
MGQLTARQTGRRAALDSQAAYRRERQERDRRIDALAGNSKHVIARSSMTFGLASP